MDFSSYSTVATMPKHSQLVSCNAAKDILRAYIVNNAALLPMINLNELKMIGMIFGEVYSYNFITGRIYQCGSDCIPALMKLLP